MSPFLTDPASLDVEEIIVQLTLDEKVSLTAGKDFWHTVPIPRLGVPSIRLSDGPNGVRGTRFFDSVPSTCIPCGTAIGATFDANLAVRIGHMLGNEAKAKGVHVLLGPTVNIQRGPLGGRGFESFSEDPFLSGVIAGHYCKGVQQENIAATLKHFVCNDMEDERMAVNVIVTERALREIYLLPFMIAIRLAQPRAIMTSYSQVNGTHVAEHHHILQDILRDEWKWNGLVMSDWFGTYSTTGAVQAGLDLEMPGPSRWRGPALIHAVVANKVKKETLDARVRNVLNLVNYTRNSGVPENAEEREMDIKEHRSLARQVAAESIVLLKNSVLPLKKTKVAVIGPNSKIATYCGGGSASLRPYYKLTPLECLAAKAEVEFCQGTYGHQSLPQLGPQLHTPDGKPGFEWRVYNDPPQAETRRILETRVLTDSDVFFLDYNHPELAPIWFSDAEGTFLPEESGTYDFGLTVQGTGKLYVDGTLLVSNVENQMSGPSFLGCGTVEETATLDLVAGRKYKILVQWGCAKTSKLKVPGVVDFGHGGFRFSACKKLPDQAIMEAVDLARSAEQIVLFAGLSGEWESEGRDRKTMDLPPNTDELISRVLDANPNTVVVIQSGTPVTMPWIEKAGSVVHAWYGGNETGNAIADVIFGDVNPCGKLPLTIPRKLKQNPAYLNFKSEGGRCLYGEDVYVGYRYYEKAEVEPLFPFGHGLSYTTFELSDIIVGECTRVKIKNTGSVAGAEVVQVYVAPVTPPIERPEKELKGFAKVFLEAGAEKFVDIELDTVRSTSYWDEYSSQWCSQAGDYRVLVGTSSAGKFVEGLLQVTTTTYWTGL